MKQTIFLLMTSLFGLYTFCCTSQNVDFKNGDLIFQTSVNTQTQILKVATQSNLTHVGIIYIKSGTLYVFEAVGPVKLTLLSEWVKKGDGGNYIVSRLSSGLDETQLNKLYTYCLNQKGKRYDSKFQWSDSKIYCSELVWKAYNAIGIKLSSPKTFEDFNISSSIVKQEIKKRYGENFIKEELVVAPVDLYESSKLTVIFDNY